MHGFDVINESAGDAVIATDDIVGLSSETDISLKIGN